VFEAHQGIFESGRGFDFLLRTDDRVAQVKESVDFKSTTVTAPPKQSERVLCCFILKFIEMNNH
jgi:hypothetical protein